MLFIIVLWVAIFTTFLILGFSMVRFLNRILRRDDENDLKSEEYFILGFLTLSALTGILSVFIPVGNTLLLVFASLSLSLVILNYHGLMREFRRIISAFKSLNRPELFLIFIISLFILTAVVQKITWLDTQAYHVQNIQWIRKYAVVPGLGNLHDRFAFNSMFFVISALFTFNVKGSLIFPLNGICYIVLIVKLISLYSGEVKKGSVWKAVFYMLILLISLVTMIPNLNTPSPDIICAVLTIYAFIIVLEHYKSGAQYSFYRFAILNLLVFTCVSYKISSLFLGATIFLFLDGNVLKKLLISFGAGMLIIVPFLIRNYFLSGYLVYPFPAIDIFNVDWKVPIANVNETKSVIEAWARIPVMSYTEVLNMKFTEWIIPWYKQFSFYNKLLVGVNMLSVITFIIMIFRKDYLLAKIQFIILLNLIFWFVEAPDPRFAYGFVFMGFSLTISYMLKLVEDARFQINMTLLQVLLLCFLIIIIGRRISFPLGTLKDPTLWMVSSPFDTVETKEYSTNFKYRIPVNNQECFNTEIPCVTYQLNNVFLRGNDLKDGFKVGTQAK